MLVKSIVSRYSYAITLLNSKSYYDFQLTHGVGTCGTQRVDECSENLVAGIDKAIGKLISRIKDGSFKLSDP